MPRPGAPRRLGAAHHPRSGSNARASARWWVTAVFSDAGKSPRETGRGLA